MDRLPESKASYSHDGLRITLSIREHSLGEVVDAMNTVIRGCGFYPKGELQYVEED